MLATNDFYAMATILILVFAGVIWLAKRHGSAQAGQPRRADEARDRAGQVPNRTMADSTVPIGTGRGPERGGLMSPAAICSKLHLVLGICGMAALLRRVRPAVGFKSMERVEALRAIATLHSLRFFGLVFILPGVVGPNLPAGFAVFAAYGDLATGVLALLALLTVRTRPLFLLFVVGFNLIGAADLILDYYHAIRVGLPAVAGQLGAAYVDPDHLRARADDHPRGRVLFAVASSIQYRLGPTVARRSDRFID